MREDSLEAVEFMFEMIGERLMAVVSSAIDAQEESREQARASLKSMTFLARLRAVFKEKFFDLLLEYLGLDLYPMDHPALNVKKFEAVRDDVREALDGLRRAVEESFLNEQTTPHDIRQVVRLGRLIDSLVDDIHSSEDVRFFVSQVIQLHRDLFNFGVSALSGPDPRGVGPIINSLEVELNNFLRESYFRDPEPYLVKLESFLRHLREVVDGILHEYTCERMAEFRKS